MAKTNPIGVRFDEELLSKVKEASLATSPQKALNLYEKSFIELNDKKNFPKPDSEIKQEAQEKNKKEQEKKPSSETKFKKYDYSAMPTGLTYPQRQKWMAQARIDQNK